MLDTTWLRSSDGKSGIASEHPFQKEFATGPTLFQASVVVGSNPTEATFS